MTSLHEGSPNVVKEAMACNLPIVCTDVGDVRHLIGGLSNCFVTGFEVNEIAQALSKVIEQNQASDGRERLVALKLSSSEVASRLKSIYEKVGN
jgi:glycosyltransferase involved in cell wall biosynthesis